MQAELIDALMLIGLIVSLAAVAVALMLMHEEKQLRCKHVKQRSRKK